VKRSIPRLHPPPEVHPRRGARPAQSHPFPWPCARGSRGGRADGGPRAGLADQPSRFNSSKRSASDPAAVVDGRTSHCRDRVSLHARKIPWRPQWHFLYGTKKAVSVLHATRRRIPRPLPRAGLSALRRGKEWVFWQPLLHVVRRPVSLTAGGARSRAPVACCGPESRRRRRARARPGPG